MCYRWMNMLRLTPGWIGLSFVVTVVPGGCNFDSTGAGAEGIGIHTPGSGDDSGWSDATDDANEGGHNDDVSGTGYGDDLDGQDDANDHETGGTDYTDTNGDDSAGDGTDHTDTGNDDPTCASPVTMALWVETAQVTRPMERVESAQSEGVYARSLVAEQGYVDFAFEVPCTDEFVLWGRVYDFFPGPYLADPDSYYVRVDNGPIHTWAYGCQTTDIQWSWLPMQSGEQDDCARAVPLNATLSAGMHVLRLRNREGANAFGEFAAVARVIVTNDLGFQPGLEH